VSDEAPFVVGETLICAQGVERRDGLSHINIGERVKVLQAYQFAYEGKISQDITVQKGSDAPISVLVAPGRFKRP